MNRNRAVELIAPAAHERKAFIVENTRIASPLLCPEIKLRLITPSCPLWSATEEQLAALAIADPYWGFCWAGGQALARYILDHPEQVRGKRVVVFGAGCGIEALAAVRAGADSVLASDIDPMAVDAIEINAALNDVEIEATTEDLIGVDLSDFHTLLAGDMFYDGSFAARVLSWLEDLASRGVTVLLGDPMRGNLRHESLSKLAVYEAPADVDLDGRYRQETRVLALLPSRKARTGGGL